MQKPLTALALVAVIVLALSGVSTFSQEHGPSPDRRRCVGVAVDGVVVYRAFEDGRAEAFQRGAQGGWQTVK